MSNSQRLKVNMASRSRSILSLDQVLFGILDDGILDDGILDDGILDDGILDDGILDDDFWISEGESCEEEGEGICLQW